MTVNIVLIVVMVTFFAAGVYLLLERSLTRVLLGIILLGNGANILILATSGPAGKSPIYEAGTPLADYADPLPQALILTAIVITFAVIAFMLGIIYRSWVLARADNVQDDPEDRRVAGKDSFNPEDDGDILRDTSEFFRDDSPEAAAPDTPFAGSVSEAEERPGVQGAAPLSRRKRPW